MSPSGLKLPRSVKLAVSVSSQRITGISQEKHTQGGYLATAGPHPIACTSNLSGTQPWGGSSLEDSSSPRDRLFSALLTLLHVSQISGATLCPDSPTVPAPWAPPGCPPLAVFSHFISSRMSLWLKTPLWVSEHGAPALGDTKNCLIILQKSPHLEKNHSWVFHHSTGLQLLILCVFSFSALYKFLPLLLTPHWVFVSQELQSAIISDSPLPTNLCGQLPLACRAPASLGVEKVEQD